MNLEILDQAEKDLIEGFHFYEDQSPGLGSHFLTNLFAEIESLRHYAGIHGKKYKTYHRLLSKRFSRFTTKSKTRPPLSMRWWTAAAIPHGSENDWSDAMRLS